MVDKNSKPPADPEVVSTAPADHVDDKTTRVDTATVAVTNEDMAKFFKPNSPAGQDSTGLNANGLPLLEPLKQPGEKYLPGLEIDFGDEDSALETPTGLNPAGKQEALKEKVSGDGTADEPAAEPDNLDQKPGKDVEKKLPDDGGNDQAAGDDDIKKPTEKNTDPAVQKADATDKVKETDAVKATELKEPTLSLEQITALAKDTIKSPEELVKFNENLEAFEKRAKTDNLSKQDREEFYGQVGRVLEESKTGNKIYSSKELQTIGSDMVRQAAKPGDVNQGATSTCTTAALETALYMQEPATIARLVSDIALTGQYVTTDGGVEVIPEKNLHPDKYKEGTPPEKMRSLASHLAQPALINIHWNREDSFNGESGRKGKIRYEEGHPAVTKGDAHTRMMDYSKTPPEPFTTTSGYADPTRKDSGLYLERSVPIEGPIMQMEYLPQIYKQLRGNKGDLTIVNDKAAPGVIKPDSLEHFKTIMKDAEDRKKPVILGVHANKDPFLTDLNDSYSRTPLTEEQRKKGSTMHAHHALVATHTDKATERSTIENQWGNSVDHTDEKGQKAKLSLDTVYDTVIPKVEPKPEKEEPREKTKEPTPDEYIKSQREFVEELAKDKDSDPKVLFDERMTLHRYLDHWGHKDEAHKQAEILNSSLADRVKSDKADKSLGSNMSSYISQMNGSGEKEYAKNALKVMDERLQKSDPSDTYDFKQDFSTLLRLHRDNGDAEGGKKLAHDTVTNVLKKFGKPEDISSKQAIQTLGSMGDLMETYGVKEESTRIAEQMLSNVRSYEKTNGSDNQTVANAKNALLFFGADESVPELKKTLANETQESYDRLKDKGDISSKTSSELRFGLMHYYENTKNPKALNTLVQDSIKSIAEDPKRGIPSLDSKEFSGIYEHQAARLVRAGGTDYAIPLQEKALKIAVANKDPQDEYDKIGTLTKELVDMLDSVGRKEDADKLIKEMGVDIGHRSRRLKRD